MSTILPKVAVYDAIVMSIRLVDSSLDSTGLFKIDIMHVESPDDPQSDYLKTDKEILRGSQTIVFCFYYNDPF